LLDSDEEIIEEEKNSNCHNLAVQRFGDYFQYLFQKVSTGFDKKLE